LLVRAPAERPDDLAQHVTADDRPDGAAASPLPHDGPRRRDLDASVQRLWAASEIKPHLSQSSSVIALTFRVETPCTHIAVSAAIRAGSER
jgi:hypothetical protein